MKPGELVYLNLPLHPGSKLDIQPPRPPTGVRKRRGENMGYPGIELAWMPAHDDHWISYYEILRDGQAIDKVAKGTFYFDHSAGADLAARYDICAVDGAGNHSAKIAAKGSAAGRGKVYDDATGQGFVYSGPWRHETGLAAVHAGTLSSCAQKGAAAEIAFEGRKVLLFFKMGEDGGKASVGLDGGPAEVIDTYSADDLRGMCVWRKEIPKGGKHTLHLEVLGEHAPRAIGATIRLDAVRAER
jgi:hypothetical protein